MSDRFVIGSRGSKLALTQAEWVKARLALLHPGIDIHIEIVSPDQLVAKLKRRLVHSTSNGCPLGVLVHSERKTIDLYRPGRPPERLAADGILDGDPVLPGFRLPVAEVFGWLVHRRPAPGADPA